MNEQRCGRVTAQVGEGELAHIFAWRPRVNHVGGFPVGENGFCFKRAREGQRRKQRIGNDGNAARIIGDRDGASMAEQSEPVRERADVIQAVAEEVAVIDEKNVHAEESGEKRRLFRTTTKKTKGAKFRGRIARELAEEVAAGPPACLVRKKTAGTEACRHGTLLLRSVTVPLVIHALVGFGVVSRLEPFDKFEN